MAIEVERAGRGAGWSGTYLRAWRLPPQASGALVIAAIIGSLGILCLTRAISGLTVQTAAGAAIGLGAVGFAVAAHLRHAVRGAHLDRLSQALDAASGALAIVAPDGGAEFSNLAFDRLFSGPREPPLDRIGRAVAIDPASQLDFRRMRELAAARTHATGTLVLHPARGRPAGRFNISAGPIAGHPGSSLWTVEDITARHEMETALRFSHERFQRFFANAPVGIALVDRFGCFDEANRAVGELFGAAPQDLIGCELTGLLNEADRDGIAAVLRAAMAGQPTSEPIEIRLDHPHDRTLVLFLSPVAEPDGGLALHFVDVTQQKTLETQFAQAQKMQAVGQLAGGVAHDFNNLLTAMIGFCDLLLLRSRPGDPSFSDIMQIKQNANRAGNLVRQLLAFSRQQPLQPRTLDITDVLVELSHLLRRLIGENLELDLVHARDLGLVKVDQGQFEQVIINLAVNARDAMPDGGRLTIQTANHTQAQPLRHGHEVMPAGEYVSIAVADTGVGIRGEDLARIFDPFFSTKEIGSGTGLGLSTVYGIVKQTGGFVFVDSVPGRGTEFRICLPRCASAGGASPARPEPGDPMAIRDLTGCGTVMLVEDDDPVRIFGARALRNKGYHVIEARSGEAALDMIANAAEKIDLLITDVVMPRLDGPGLVREVREVDAAIKVIFISGYAEEAFRQRLDRDSDIHFLAKPFNLKQLATKVKEVIGVPPA